MIDAPHMLMIGSTGKHVGKTELACTLLRRFARGRKILGVKVMTVASPDGRCLHSGEALNEEYEIAEETDRTGQKDTSRLLAAGAGRVLWLRAKKPFLAQGIREVLARLDDGAPIICESNSLRSVVRPGLFLMVRGASAEEPKESAASVSRHADRMVGSNGSGFDLRLDQIDLAGTRWALRESATAIVLAGGSSRRMREDKSLLPVGGRPLIAHVCAQLRGHFSEILISANDEQKYRFLDLPIVPDRVGGRGPLMGIASTLAASSQDLNLVVGCDMPELDLPFARRLLRAAPGHDAVVPRLGGGLLEPLFAVYRKALVARMDAALNAGACRIRAALGEARVKYVDAPDPDGLRNLNTMAEYEAYVGGYLRSAALKVPPSKTP